MKGSINSNNTKFYGIATRLEADQVATPSLTTTGGEDKRAATLKYVNRPQSLVKVKDDWPIAYTAPQCVAYDSLEKIGPPKPDLRQSLFGVTGVEGIPELIEVQVGDKELINTEYIYISDASEFNEELNLYTINLGIVRERLQGYGIDASTAHNYLKHGSRAVFSATCSVEAYNSQITGAQVYGIEAGINTVKYGATSSSTITATGNTVTIDTSKFEGRNQSDYYRYVFYPQVHVTADYINVYEDFKSSFTLVIKVDSYVQYYNYAWIDNSKVKYTTLLALPLDTDVTSNYARYNANDRPYEGKHAAVNTNTLMTKEKLDLYLTKADYKLYTPYPITDTLEFDYTQKCWGISILNILPDFDEKACAFDITKVELTDIYSQVYRNSTSLSTNAVTTSSSPVNIAVKADPYFYHRAIAGDAFSVSTQSDTSALVSKDRKAQQDFKMPGESGAGTPGYKIIQGNSLYLFVKPYMLDKIALTDNPVLHMCLITITLESYYTAAPNEKHTQEIDINIYYGGDGVITETGVCKYRTTTHAIISGAQNQFNIQGHSNTYDVNTDLSTIKWTSKEPPSSVLNNAFKNGQVMTDIWLPSSITSLGNYAFYGSAELENIYYRSNGTPKIGNYTFAQCPRLFQFNWKNGKEVGAYAFQGSRLNRVSFTGAHTTTTTDYLQEGCFADCVRLQKIDFKDVNLSSFPKNMCIRDADLQSIFIPNSVRTIHPSAFEASGIQTISSNVSSSQLKKIDTRAFFGCQLQDLTTVRLPESVQHISDYAFASNYMSTALIPESITYLGTGHVFNDCEELQTIEWHALRYDSAARPFEDVETQILNMNFAEDVQIIAPYLCYNFMRLHEIKLPGGNKLTKIGEYAFYNTTTHDDVSSYRYLVTIPSSVNEIGQYAFAYSDGITSLSSLTTTLPEWAQYVCYNCSSMTALAMPPEAQTTVINQGAFSECAKLSTVKLSNKIHTIKRDAFSGDSKYTFKCGDIDSPLQFSTNLFNQTDNYIFSHVKEIWEYALHGTKWWLDHLSVHDGHAYLVWVNTVLYGVSPSIMDDFTIDLSKATCVSGHTLGNYHNKCKEVKMPKSSPCTYIGDDSFYDGSVINSNLSDSEKADIPANIRHIGRCAFSGCSKMFKSKLQFPSTLRELGASAFSRCSSIQEVDLSLANLTNISNGLFADCSSLKSIKLPAGITSIESSVFKECSSLTNINIPAGVTQIESETFYNSGIKTINGASTLQIPSQITSIGSRAFWSCNSITTIKFPYNKEIEIGISAFEYCYGLKTIYMSKHSKLKNHSFRFCHFISTIYFDGTEDDWKKLRDANDYAFNQNDDIFHRSEISIKYNQTW